MGVVSEEENKGVQGNNGDAGDGRSKPKRQMKTPFQLEILENSYASNAYPSEATRAALAEKLCLTDRQLQMWFCHRRLKDKREAAVNKRLLVEEFAAPHDSSLRFDESGGEHRSRSVSGSRSRSMSGSGSGSSPVSYREQWREVSRKAGVRPLMIDDDDMPPAKREKPAYGKLTPPVPVLENRAVALVEDQLGEPLRSDGPILGMEFDPLPPDAFGAPIAMLEHQGQHRSPFMCNISENHDSELYKAATRSHYKYQDDQHLDNVRSDLQKVTEKINCADDLVFFRHPSSRLGFQVDVSPEEDDQDLYSSSPGDNDYVLRQKSVTNPDVDPASMELSASSGYELSVAKANLQIRRKRKVEGDKVRYEPQAHKKRMKRGLEKEDNLRLESEERMRRQMAKHVRERKKEEKLLRERKKEEEKLLREKLREEGKLLREKFREDARREKLLEFERLKAERKRQKEESLREKEAAKRKAATEKAAARRLAREFMGLVDDDELEQMELDSCRKQLHLSNSMEQEKRPDTLSEISNVFPPKSVQLKRPFAFQPWIKSEENIGNLLMVWRFFISFADVLEIWPFTLDELVQAFHDPDSRLLSEVHVALLKLVIKDIEDASNSEGGHQGIVEGAYAWGFDILSWQQHLNALTWPEILRQLALSAGFGPQIKKCTAALKVSNEDIGREDVVSTLRNGSAAENAAAMMQEKSSSARRSKHLLTPGTVKFAAFHVLSLEGSQGLTIPELADKIQKSGLRDLTASKAPEASIAAALSRDAKIFERTAPYTYRVRSPFRKDPADAESILAAARENLKVLENGVLTGKSANMFERDGDSDCDVAEVSEDEDGSPLTENIMDIHSSKVETCLGSGKEIFKCAVSVREHSESENVQRNDSKSQPSGSKDVNDGPVDHNAGGEDIGAPNVPEYVEIDESKSYERWVLGLTEGEYSSLSVEDRLASLGSLVIIVNEGKSIRTVLENRLGAAHALKKQMSMDAQLDKKYMIGEEGTKLDPFVMSNEECKFDVVHDKHAICSDSIEENLKSSPIARTMGDKKSSVSQKICTNEYDKYAAERSRSKLKSYVARRVEESYVYRSLPLGQDRRHNRYWQFVASSAKSDPGAGRIFIELHDGQWRLIDSEEAYDALLMSLDVRGVREYHLHSILLKIEASFKESVRKTSKCTRILGESKPVFGIGAFGSDLSPRSHENDGPHGVVCRPDSNLMEQLSSEIQCCWSEAMDDAALGRCQDFQRWTWQDCFSSTSCAKRKGKRINLSRGCNLCLDFVDPEVMDCLACQKTLITSDEHNGNCEEKREVSTQSPLVVTPYHFLQMRLLKALMAFIEVSIPSEAFQSFWEESRRAWGMKLYNSSSAEDLLQALTLLEGALKLDYLSKFETTNELLGLTTSPESSAQALPVLPWIPLTTAAIGLRVLELDASISYKKLQKDEPHHKEGDEAMDLMPRDMVSNSSKDVDQLTEVCEDGEGNGSAFVNLKPKHKSSGCHQGSCGQDHSDANKMKLPKKDVYCEETVWDEEINRKSECQRVKSQAQVCEWGRRIVRKKRTDTRTVQSS